MPGLAGRAQADAKRPVRQMWTGEAPKELGTGANPDASLIFLERETGIEPATLSLEG